MKLLITGGFGYLGGRLAQYLAGQDGVELLLGSRRPEGPPSWLPSAKPVQLLWCDDAALEATCDGVDAIVHLAGMNAGDCAADPVAALEMNGVSTARLVHAAIRKGVARFVYMSTAHVYGSPLAGEITEQSCPLNLHPYATSHRAGEDVVLAAAHNGMMEGIVLRLSNAFGVPTHAGANCWMLLVNDLCRQAVMERSLTLRSSGLDQRNFVTIQDVARACWHMISLGKEKTDDGVFNVGGNRALRIIDMAKLIQARCSDVLGFTPNIIHPDPPENYVASNLHFHIDKLSASGFEISGNVSSEIDATLLFCRSKFAGNGQ